MQDIERLKITEPGIITPDRWNALIAEVQKSAIINFRGGTFARSVAGTILALGRQTSGGLTVASPLPLDLKVGTDSLGNPQATIVPGALNSIPPGNLFSTFAVALTGTYYFKLAATSNGSQVTGCTAVIDGALPAIQTPVASALPVSFQALIGILKDGAWYRCIGDASPVATPVVVYRTDKPSPLPGEMPYLEWNAWEVR